MPDMEDQDNTSMHQELISITPEGEKNPYDGKSFYALLDAREDALDVLRGSGVVDSDAEDRAKATVTAIESEIATRLGEAERYLGSINRFFEPNWENLQTLTSGAKPSVDRLMALNAGVGAASFSSVTVRPIPDDKKERLDGIQQMHFENQRARLQGEISGAIRTLSEEEAEQEVRAKAAQEAQRLAEVAREQAERQRILDEEENKKRAEAQRLMYVTTFRGFQNVIGEEPPSDPVGWQEAVDARYGMVRNFLLADDAIRRHLQQEIVQIISDSESYGAASKQLTREIGAIISGIPGMDEQFAESPGGLALRAAVDAGIRGIGILLTDVEVPRAAERAKGDSPQTTEVERRERQEARHGFLATALEIDLGQEVRAKEQERLDREAEEQRKAAEQAARQQTGTARPEAIRTPESEALSIINTIEGFDMTIDSRTGSIIPENQSTRSRLTGLVDRLEHILEGMAENSEIRRLCEARLHLHDAEKTLRKATSKGVKTAEFLDLAYAEENLQRYSLVPKDFKTLYTNGLPVSEALNMLRTATLNGLTVVIERDGARINSRVKLADSKATAKDKERVYAEIVNQLTGGGDATRRANVELALKLARRLAYVQGEEDIWNRKNYDTGVVSTIIDYQGYRRSKDPYPAMTIDAIPTIPVCAFVRDVKVKRYAGAREIGEEYLVMPGETDVVRRNAEDFTVDMRTVDWDRLEESNPNAYRTWVANRVANALKVRDFLRTDTFKTAELVSPAYWAGAESAFEKVCTVDGNKGADELGLRAIWVACIYAEVMDAQAAGSYYDLSLDDQIAKFEIALIAPVKEGRSFLSRRERDWALDHGRGWLGKAGRQNQRRKAPGQKHINPDRPRRQFNNGRLVILD